MPRKEIYDWVDAQLHLKPTEKAALIYFAGLADPGGEFFLLHAAVERRLNLKRRRSQQLVRSLEAYGLIRNTLRWRRRNGTRNPIYRLLWSRAAGQHDAPPAGAELHPAQCSSLHSPIKSKGAEESSDELSQLEATFQSAWRIHPVGGLMLTNYPEARRLWHDIAREHGAGELAAAHALWVSQFEKSRNGPQAPGLNGWLKQERFRAFIASPSLEARSPAVRGCAIPEDLLADFERRYPGEQSLQRCGWRAADRTILPPTEWIHGRLKERWTEFVHLNNLQVERPTRL